MSNYTHNLIETDTPEVIKCILNENKNIDYSLIIPEPDEYEGTWEDWAYDNWGTKWGDVTWLDEGYAFVWFDSPWSGPVHVFEALCSKFPKAVISFHSSTSDGGGYIVKDYENSNGELKVTKDFIESFEDDL